MYFLAIAVIALLLFTALEQAIAVAVFLAFCRRAPKAMGEDELPDVLVVLALRGCDPSLDDCLRGLFRQDYPRYRVRVVVDNPADPAGEIVTQATHELSATHVEKQFLKAPSETCSLKCSALLQATEDLDDAVDVVAFLDADVAPHKTWLRELVAPLADERVGAAMGNRWYSPRLARWGSLVRVIWNVGAVVNMYFWKVPWGGTLAVRADILRQSDLRQMWTRAGCDDVPLYSVLTKRRQRLVFVPSLLLVNQEDCDIAPCLRFMTRQLLWVRLYHPVCWWVCAVFNFLIVGGQMLALLLLPIAALAGWSLSGAWAPWSSIAVWLAISLIVNLVVTFALVAALQRYADRVIAQRSNTVATRWLKFALALPLAQLVSAVGLLSSLFARRVEWRGVQYRIGGPWDIRMVEYRPYGRAEEQGSEQG